jgi:3-hydroxybutyryl-CoA dehydratase
MFKAGEEFETDFVVNQEVYDGFIHIFKDKNPLHTNNEFAISMGFAAKVMHGNILNGFISYFIGERLAQKNVFILTQEIAFSNPVYLNDEIKLIANIVDVHESVKVADFKFVFKNKIGKKVAHGKIKLGYK